MTQEPFEIEYEVTREDHTWRYRMSLDAASMRNLEPPPPDPPEWTQMSFCTCQNCPLDPATHPHCPLALQLARLINKCSDLISYEDVQVTVTTPQRVYSKETTAQLAIGSIMGLVIATSDCPRTRRFRPMARFHLPFANESETVFRAASSYLLAQYLRVQSGLKPDWTLDGLQEFYLDINQLNMDFCRRIRHAMEKDSSANALVFLDFLAQIMQFHIESSLGDLRALYAPYLEDLES